MIIKTRTFPRDIEQLQAIERRLQEEHPQSSKAKELLKVRLSGHKGEIALDYPLSFLPDHYQIFHHLRLFDGTHHFQMDGLILTDAWILIIEAKNIGGDLFYNQQFNFLSRTRDDESQTFSDPVLQVRRHRRQLQHWLKWKDFPEIPIYCLVANSHPATSIQTDDPSLDIVIRTETLPERIQNIADKHQGQPFSPSIVTDFCREILQSHKPYHFNYMRKLAIKECHLKKGVFCPACRWLAMIWEHGKWKCPHCEHKDKTAHLQALKDYCLLFDPVITSKDLRAFLMIHSIHTAQRILKNLGLRYEGKNKGRVYHLKC